MYLVSCQSTFWISWSRTDRQRRKHCCPSCSSRAVDKKVFKELLFQPDTSISFEEHDDPDFPLFIECPHIPITVILFFWLFFQIYVLVFIYVI